MLVLRMSLHDCVTRGRDGIYHNMLRLLLHTRRHAARPPWRCPEACIRGGLLERLVLTFGERINRSVQSSGGASARNPMHCLAGARGGRCRSEGFEKRLETNRSVGSAQVLSEGAVILGRPLPTTERSCHCVSGDVGGRARSRRAQGDESLKSIAGGAGMRCRSSPHVNSWGMRPCTAAALLTSTPFTRNRWLQDGRGGAGGGMVSH